MIILTCPNCGQRNVSEFRYGGEITTRPDPNTVTPEAWGAYLHMRKNVLGVMPEWWYHQAGCGCWFIAERHTKTQEVIKTYFWESPQAQE
jgi:sarcosine oxidase, subunit delta